MVGWVGLASRGEGVVTSGSSSLHSLCKEEKKIIDLGLFFKKIKEKKI